MSNLDGIVCTPDEIARSLDPATQGSIHCLTRDQSIGLTVVAETGLISMIAVLFVFWIIFRNVFRRLKRLPKETRWHIFQEPMDVLMSSLFFADLIQALGAVMDLKWIVDGHVEIGAFCTAQGVIQQLGETGVAITTLAIAVYTFIGVWWGIGIGAVFVSKLVVGALWLFIFLMIVIGNATHLDRSKLYESPTPYWCWIGQDYLQFRIWGEYFWFWITLAVSFISYVLLFFWSRGTIERDESSWWRFTINRSGSVEGGKRSFTMLFYPIVYSALILPTSVVRWIGFVQERGGKQNHISSAATLTVIAIYGLSGFCNVILLLSTRPSSVLFGRRVIYDTGRAPSHVHARSTTDAIPEIALEEPRKDVGRLPSR